MVTSQPLFEIRPVIAGDAEIIAGLHTESWRDAYRGILADGYLDGNILSERQAHWRARLDDPTPSQFGLLALLDSVAVGFAFAFPHADERWGTNLDNLHVRPTVRGGGIGSRLLHAVTLQILRHHSGEGLYLWVYELNVRTRAYYERLGAQQIERAVIAAPGGGTVAEWRYAWPDIDVLHAATKASSTRPELR